MADPTTRSASSRSQVEIEAGPGPKAAGYILCFFWLWIPPYMQLMILEEDVRSGPKDDAYHLAEMKAFNGYCRFQAAWGWRSTHS